MQLDVPGGKYVVAVSGGVDSVVLLDLLRLYPGVQITVAHFDHGIREDSADDRQFVGDIARRHSLPYIYDVAQLGQGASEAQARDARYNFLHRVRDASGAGAIITAHHQDDVVETMLLNLLRGTGRKGLTSLVSGEGIIRPLLDVPKTELIDYAKRHGLLWREDSTNINTDYVRNYVRHKLLGNSDPTYREQLLAIHERMQRINSELDQYLGEAVTPHLARDWFSLLPHDVAKEVLATWLREHGIRDFTSDTLERLTVAAKVAQPGKAIDIVKGSSMYVDRDYLALTDLER